jgi:hypothetical protein
VSTPVYAELVIVPTAEELRQEAYEIWATVAHRSVARTRSVLEQRYQDVTVELPSKSALHNWIRRHEWEQRANEDLRERYPRELREFALGQWRLLQGYQQRMLDALCGAGPELSKEEIKAYEVLLKSTGQGAYGFNQGGPLKLEFEMTDQQWEALSVDERLRRLRAGYVDQNIGVS